MSEALVFETIQDLQKHISEINVLIFKDEESGKKKVKTLIIIGGHSFQEVVTVGEPIDNLIYIQNRSINMLLDIAEEKIRAGEFTEIDGVPVSFSSDAEIDPADIPPAGHARY